MWKYTHTDEMYHSLTNKNELFHSDTYLGQDFSDGIRHFKYIKREMVNGRWRYYYSNAEYNAAKSNLRKANTNYNVASKLARKADNNYTRAQNEVVLGNLGKEVANAFHKSEKNPLKKIKTKKTLKRATKEYGEAIKERNKAHEVKKAYDTNKNDKAKQLDKYQAEYDKVAKKTKVQRAVGNTAVKVANAVSETDYKIKKAKVKGKKAVKNALKKVFPESHTSKTYHGDKITTTKYVNGKQVSKATEKNKLTEKVKKRNEKEKKKKKTR